MRESGRIAARSAFALFAAVSTSLTLACELVVGTNDLSGGPDDDSGSADGSLDAVTHAGDAPDSTTAADSSVTNADSGAIDSTTVDSSHPDTGTKADSGVRDASRGDATVVDTGIPDTGAPDSHAVTCAAGGARVFVTNEMFTGDLGGMSGADRSCASAAAAAGLGGTTWNAWLSDSNTSALNRIYKVTGAAGYTLIDGTMVAATWSTLVSKNTPLLHPIDLTEVGTVVTNNFEVWTGTDLSGATPPGYCGSSKGSWSSFTHDAGTPFVGLTNNTNPSWTDVYEQFCDVTNERLFCFERCP